MKILPFFPRQRNRWLIGLLAASLTGHAIAVSIPISADAYIENSTPTTPHNVASLVVKAGGPDRKAYLRFNLGGAPAGVISDAVLTLTPTGWTTNKSATFAIYGLSGTPSDSWN